MQVIFFFTNKIFSRFSFQLHPIRACQRKTLGLDSTLAGHIVVVMMDVEPFLAGCISPYNQVGLKV